MLSTVHRRPPAKPARRSLTAGLVFEGEDQRVGIWSRARGRERRKEAVGGEPVGVGSLLPYVDDEQRAALLANVVGQASGDGRRAYLLDDLVVVPQAHAWGLGDVDVAHGDLHWEERERR